MARPGWGRPQLVARFDNLALLKVAGEHGFSALPVPDVAAEKAMREYRNERHIKHPAMEATANRAAALFSAALFFAALFSAALFSAANS